MGELHKDGMVDSTTDELESPECILSIEGVSKEFSRSRIFRLSKSKIKAVSDVSLKLHKGETLGLVGESGSGKTTLAKLIVGIYTSDMGTIYFHGKDCSKLSRAKRKAKAKKVVMVFQDVLTTLNSRFPVLELILEPMEVHGLLDKKKQIQGSS